MQDCLRLKILYFDAKLFFKQRKTFAFLSRIRTFIEKGWVPAYHFAICNPNGIKMGSCDLRIGHNDKLYYGGNIGYRVETGKNPELGTVLLQFPKLLDPMERGIIGIMEIVRMVKRCAA